MVGRLCRQFAERQYVALQSDFPRFTLDQLLQATAASYNFGTGNISGNPRTIDVGSTGNNYGSNGLEIIKSCLKW
jgi:hypothetical protein